MFHIYYSIDSAINYLLTAHHGLGEEHIESDVRYDHCLRVDACSRYFWVYVHHHMNLQYLCVHPQDVVRSAHQPYGTRATKHARYSPRKSGNSIMIKSQTHYRHSNRIWKQGHPYITDQFVSPYVVNKCNNFIVSCRPSIPHCVVYFEHTTQLRTILI